LTLILILPKPCSSNSEASHSARFDERFRGGLAVLLHHPGVQRSGVDADADRDARVAGRLGNLFDPAVELLDVAGG